MSTGSEEGYKRSRTLNATNNLWQRHDSWVDSQTANSKARDNVT